MKCNYITRSYLYFCKYCHTPFPRKMPIGIQSFEYLRRNDYVYVDETALVYLLVTLGNLAPVPCPKCAVKVALGTRDTLGKVFNLRFRMR